MPGQAERLFADAQRLHQRGKLAEARRLYERILAVDPAFGIARVFLAIILQQTGQVHAAVEEARRGMADLKRPAPGTWVNYGVILKNAGLLQEAARAYEEALTLAPDLLSAKANLSSLYLVIGKLDRAEELCLTLTETLEEAGPWLNLTRIALARGDEDRAEECLRRAGDIAPKEADVPFLRADILRRHGDDEGAFVELRRALSLRPAHAGAWTAVQGLSPTALDLDVLERLARSLAEARVQQAVLLAAVVDICRKNLLWEPLEALEKQLAEILEGRLDRAPGSSACFTLLGAKVPQRAHLKAADATWRQLFGRARPLPPRPLAPRAPDAPVRVGFLSSDLRGHAIGYLIVGLFERLPHGRVEWYAYNNSFRDDSQSRTRIRANMDRFVNVAPLDGRELAQRIRDDAIDILIELNGMTRDTCAGVMALRPAPIQITWLGMPGTLGAGQAVDYVIGDAWTTWTGNADGFAEKIIQLPRSYQPNDHLPPDLSLAGTRAEHGLPEQGAVFCCFNQHYKISPDTFALWTRILKEVDGSVLWLLDLKNDGQRERLRGKLQEAGIDPARLVLAGSLPQDRHIARISHADLVLDTWPYNAHTTCSDALRAGVPVVTLPGSTFASRVAAGILATGNLAEWIADTPEAYVQKAVAFARQPRAVLDAAKARVRETYWASPMVDNDLFSRQLEALCLALYDRHAAGLPAAHLRLDAQGAVHPLDLGDVPPHTPVPEASSPEKGEPVAARKTPDSQSRWRNLRRLQRDLLGLKQSPLILDIGAAPIDGQVGFEGLADEGLVEVLGFEPAPEAFERLMRQKRPHRRYEPVAVLDGEQATLHLCTIPGMNSCLEPDRETLSLFPMFAQWGQVVETRPLHTVRLDDVPGAAEAALIKCDTQGCELRLLRHAAGPLARAVLLLLELSPLPLYRGEAGLFATGRWLEEQGWRLHTFSHLNKRMLKPLGDDAAPHRARNHIFQVDAIFMPDPRRWDRLTPTQLRELAFLAHAMFRSYDLSMRALWTLDRREGGALAEAYAAYLQDAGLEA